MNAIAQTLAAQSMVSLLTVPYRRGAETLAIPIGADTADGTAVRAYDFSEYRARHGVDPARPRYVVFARTNLGRNALKLEVDFSFQGVERTALLEFPCAQFWRRFVGHSVARERGCDAQACAFSPEVDVLARSRRG